MKPGRGHQVGGPWLEPHTKADQRIDRHIKRRHRERETRRDIKEQTDE